MHGDGLLALQFRRTPGGATEEIRSPVSAPDVIQLERAGNSYVPSAAHFGDTLVAVRIRTWSSAPPYVGLFVCAHNDSVIERATFRDYGSPHRRATGSCVQDYIGSNLEILEVARRGDRQRSC